MLFGVAFVDDGAGSNVMGTVIPHNVVNNICGRA